MSVADGTIYRPIDFIAANVSEDKAESIRGAIHQGV